MGNLGYDGSEVTLSEALPNHALVLTLIFPASECERDGPVEIVNSPVTVEIRRIDIADKICTAAAEQVARDVLGSIPP
jgi:hypothetical protein